MNRLLYCSCGRLAVTSAPDRFQPVCLACARGEMHAAEQVCHTLTRREQEARRNTRLSVLVALTVVVMLYAQCALQPRPSRVWMGDTLRRSVVAQETGGRR